MSDETWFEDECEKYHKTAAKIPYAERLFKIKQLEHMRWLKVQDGPFDEPMREVEEIDTQISKLLED